MILGGCTEQENIISFLNNKLKHLPHNIAAIEHNPDNSRHQFRLHQS